MEAAWGVIAAMSRKLNSLKLLGKQENSSSTKARGVIRESLSSRNLSSLRAEVVWKIPIGIQQALLNKECMRCQGIRQQQNEEVNPTRILRVEGRIDFVFSD